MLGILAPPPCWRVRSVASSRTSRRAVIPIIPAGSSGSRHCSIHHLRTRVPRSRWRTSSRPRWAKRSTAHANAPSNRCSASSRRCWASASSPCAVNWPKLSSGAWSVGLQSQALPYLIWSVTQEQRHACSPLAHDHRPFSVGDHVPLSRFRPCCEGRTR